MSGGRMMLPRIRLRILSIQSSCDLLRGCSARRAPAAARPRASCCRACARELRSRSACARICDSRSACARTASRAPPAHASSRAAAVWRCARIGLPLLLAPASRARLSSRARAPARALAFRLLLRLALGLALRLQRDVGFARIRLFDDRRRAAWAPAWARAAARASAAGAGSAFGWGRGVCHRRRRVELRRHGLGLAVLPRHARTRARAMNSRLTSSASISAVHLPRASRARAAGRSDVNGARHYAGVGRASSPTFFTPPRCRRSSTPSTSS